ncbi:MAG: hypothetical protein ACOC2Y_00055 [Spirochaetota bacterium]
MRRVAIVLVVLAVIAGAGFADGRADLGVNIPWQLGATLDESVGETEDPTLNVLSELAFLLPEAMISYEAPVGPVNLGVGVRAFTFLIESIAYPAAYAEIDVGPAVVNLNVGGGAFLLFGVFNHFETASLVIPDLSAHLKLGEALRVGIGTASFLGGGDQDVVPWVIYLSGKFIVRF